MKKILLLFFVLCLFGCSSRFVNLPRKMQDALYMAMTESDENREYFGMIISEREDFPKEKRFLLSTEGAVSLLSIEGCCGCKSDIPEYFGKLYLPVKIGDMYLRNAEDAKAFAISFTRKRIEEIVAKMGGEKFELIRIKPNTDLYRFEIAGKTRSVFFVPGSINLAPKDPVRDAIMGFSVIWQSNCWVVFPGQKKMKKGVILPDIKRDDREFREIFMAKISEDYLTCGFDEEKIFSIKGTTYHVK